MQDTGVAAVISAVLGAMFGAGGVGAYLKHKLDSRKMDTDHNSAMIARLEKRVDYLEQKHEECQEENAALREELGRLREALARLERRV